LFQYKHELAQLMKSAHTGQPVVSCRDTSKEFGEGANVVHALRDVSLDIWPGELTLIVGPSGCGKTTLLSVIAGILDQTSGDVAVLGTELGALSARQKTAFRGQHIGFVFQQFNLLPALTAAENAAVPLLVADKPRVPSIRQAAELLHEMGMEKRVSSYPKQLSGGEQQRVAIARALIREPQLIVCDEPTSALDAKTGHSIMELLKRVAVQPNRAVVVVTHDPRVFPFGDRMATMEDGQVVEVSTNGQDKDSSNR
jgi:putative ABC transport system ATP-binding protein